MSTKSTTFYVQSSSEGMEEVIPQKESESILKETRIIMIRGIKNLLPLFFSQVDDDLFKRAEFAETNSRQSQLFDAMRLVRKERENLQNHYLTLISEKFVLPAKYVQSNTSIKSSSSEAGLKLIEDSALEESLAINGMVEKGNALFQELLSALQQRFSWLLGKEIELEQLPISPAYLGSTLSDIFQKLEIDLSTKLLIYKIYDKQVISKLDEIYFDINDYLVENGILPTLPVKVKRPHSSERESSTDSTPVLTADQVSELNEYLETFRNLQGMMDTWRKLTGATAMSNAALLGAPVVGSEQIISAMDLLQNSLNDNESDGLISPGLLKEKLTQKIQAKVKGGTIAQSEEDTIDMVGIIFDFILDDKNVDAVIKCLIARLQIPIIKVAIIDKTFFANKNHPSRLLLNDLAQAGIGLIAPETDAPNPVIQKVDEIVQKILNDFSKESAIFETLRIEFADFMEKENKKSSVNETRTLQATQSREKIWLAKRAVASEITTRLQNIDAPATFRTFIYNDWKDVMFLAYLRKDRNPDEWDKSLATLDKLIWSITPAYTVQDRTKLIRELPSIVKGIREGLQSTSLDALQIKSLLQDLEVCHMAALHPNSIKNALKVREISNVTNPETILPTEDVIFKDAELAEAILEIKSHLPDISNVDVEEVIIGGTEKLDVKESVNWLLDFGTDENTRIVNNLKVGMWMEFMADNGTYWRAKLAWKSQVTSNCVFVNRRGVKVLELKMNDLILRMRQGRARVADIASVPMMDRAISFLTQTIQNPFVKDAEAAAYA